MQAVSSAISDRVLPSDRPSAAMLARLKGAIATDLAPLVSDIDLRGKYPSSFLHRVGEIGGFGQAVSLEYGGSGNGIWSAIQVIEAISQECLCTGFMSWCQIACTWYMQNSDNPHLKQQILPLVATGKVLGGTGLSNPMKHFAGIEKIALIAERKSGGYVLNGMLPWVSNVGPGHYFGIAAQLLDQDDYLMAIVSDDLAGLTLRQNAHFIALEGSNTFSCVFRDVFVPDEQILAAPCTEYLTRIRPGFILTQVGMGLGLVASCIELMERSNQRYGHVNQFLDDQADELAADLRVARQTTQQLADELTDRNSSDRALLRAVIQARITASELSLRASQAAMLHAGARGYLHGAAVERKLRESYFVAIVTPALKQLKKMLHDLSTL
ncbi:acyl-CoA/acyl-ACP dehydrogenase [Leptolyngbya sp. FACHB-36]|uniref:acyl-CoA dehydrogenase family protein n=1 Tax=Leptolyngbya sp. FACHB-36 TaxID=2692808 RepID=UPI001681422B|nr:acyl-CoA dehydrogenase family protein [Leptolyngbya sp. FACHB-36]MBD2020512.1 acyl-CoA/acyl-ACP dehydrogenase [Leptolyngbya sp. FACHB-36]